MPTEPAPGAVSDVVWSNQSPTEAGCFAWRPAPEANFHEIVQCEFMNRMLCEVAYQWPIPDCIPQKSLSYPARNGGEWGPKYPPPGELAALARQAADLRECRELLRDICFTAGWPSGKIAAIGNRQVAALRTQTPRGAE